MDFMKTLADSSGFLVGITAFVLIIPVIFGLLNCFFGYKLLKIWMALCGFLLGAIASGIIVCRMTEEGWIIGAVILAAAVICAMISYQVYLIGAFFISWVMTFLALNKLIGSLQTSGRNVEWIFIFSILVGLLVAILIVKFSKPMIILFTGISGAVSAGGSIAQLLKSMNTQMMILLVIVLAAAGILVQIKMNHGLFHRK